MSFVPILLSLISPAAWPQDAAPEERAQLEGMPTIYVTSDAGGEVSGTLVGLADDAVTVLVGDRRHRFALEHVSKIEAHGDSVKNGALVGALIGVAAGIVTSRLAECVDDDGRVGACGAGAKLGFVALSTGVYAGIGAGVDALFPGRSTLYDAKRSAAASPGVGGFRLGIKLSW